MSDVHLCDGRRGDRARGPADPTIGHYPEGHSNEADRSSAAKLETPELLGAVGDPDPEHARPGARREDTGLGERDGEWAEGADGCLRRGYDRVDPADVGVAKELEGDVERPGVDPPDRPRVVLPAT